MIASGPILKLDEIKRNQRGFYICCMLTRSDDKSDSRNYICASAELQLNEENSTNQSGMRHLEFPQKAQQQHSRQLLALSIILLAMTVLVCSIGCLLYFFCYKKRIELLKTTQFVSEMLKNVSCWCNCAFIEYLYATLNLIYKHFTEQRTKFIFQAIAEKKQKRVTIAAMTNDQMIRKQS